MSSYQKTKNSFMNQILRKNFSEMIIHFIGAFLVFQFRIVLDRTVSWERVNYRRDYISLEIR